MSVWRTRGQAALDWDKPGLCPRAGSGELLLVLHRPHLDAPPPGSPPTPCVSGSWRLPGLSCWIPLPSGGHRDPMAGRSCGLPATTSRPPDHLCPESRPRRGLSSRPPSPRATPTTKLPSPFFSLHSPRRHQQGLGPARQPLAVPVRPLHRRRGGRQGPRLRAHLAVPALRHLQPIRDIRGRPHLSRREPPPPQALPSPNLSPERATSAEGWVLDFLV